MEESDGTPLDHFIKISLIGASGVGKTSLMLRFVDDTFAEDVSTTIGMDCEVKTVQVENQSVKVQVWDTAGQEVFTTVSSAHYRVDGIMVIYSSVDQESFLQSGMWFNEINRYAPEGVCRMLVGNMSDCSSRMVDETTAKRYANEMGSPFIETSAKDGTNVEEAFMSLLRRIIEDPISSYNKKKKRTSMTKVQASVCCVLQ